MRIWITGLGSVGPSGGLEELEADLRAGRTVTEVVDRSDGYHRSGGARRAALVGAEAWRRRIPPLKARRMSAPSRFAVAAALEAVEADPLGEALDRCGVYLGTAFGPSAHTEGLLRQVFLEGPQAASPMLFTESVANAPAAQVALSLGARGANVTVTQRDCSTLLAVGEAVRDLRSGRSDVALAGGVEELNPLLHSILDRFGTLAGSRGGDEVGRPFDRARNGRIAGEGSTVLVLRREVGRSLPEAVAVEFCARGFDPRADATGWGPDGELLGRRLARALEAAGWDSVDAVVSGASGCRQGDRAEARVLRSAFGGAVPPTFTPKAITGDWGGGQLAAAVLLARGVEAAPASWFRHEDPEIGLRPAAGGVGAPARILLSSMATGGGACWLGLERRGTG